MKLGMSSLSFKNKEGIPLLKIKADGGSYIYISPSNIQQIDQVNRKNETDPKFYFVRNNVGEVIGKITKNDIEEKGVFHIIDFTA